MSEITLDSLSLELGNVLPDDIGCSWRDVKNHYPHMYEVRFYLATCPEAQVTLFIPKIGDAKNEAIFAAATASIALSKVREVRCWQLKSEKT